MCRECVGRPIPGEMTSKIFAEYAISRDKGKKPALPSASGSAAIEAFIGSSEKPRGGTVFVSNLQPSSQNRVK